MKRVLCLFAIFAVAPTAWADMTFSPLSHVTSDAAPDMFCDLSLGLNEANEVQGVQYECKGSKEYKDFYPIEQVRTGFVIFHYDALNIDVISVKAPGFDAVHGGAVTIHYLSNYLKNEYADWTGLVEVMGTKWVGYTTPAQGHKPFNDLFGLKRTVLGQLVGIQEVRATWK